MSCIGNLIWLIFGGFFAALGYFAGGLLACLTIIGFPFGVQAFKIGVATLAPFGLEIRESESAGEPVNVILNIIWAVLFGWEITLMHLTAALILAITIVGIPFAQQHIKLIPLAIAPFGRELA